MKLITLRFFIIKIIEPNATKYSCIMLKSYKNYWNQIAILSVVQRQNNNIARWIIYFNLLKKFSGA